MRVRDAVFGDIILGQIEEACIRTSAFQRLHRIKQLGNAFHVYPCATHTRFEHSLGVYHQIKRLMAQETFLADYPVKMNDTEKTLVAMIGLLHDITHTPFKHTLDRDAGILPEPDQQEEYESRFEQMRMDNIVGGDMVQGLVTALAAKDARDLPKPFHRQVVEDTFSADLLDYSRRDAYFTTGVKRNWDERIYDHIGISDFPEKDGKPHLVARLIDETGKPAASARTELVNLLQIRYVLNERVYFYPTKIAADALLVKSVRNLLMSGGSQADAKSFQRSIREFSDEQFVHYLATKQDGPTSKFAQMLYDRRLPKLAVSLGADQVQLKRVAKICWGDKGLDKWAACEKAIADEAGLTESDQIIVYCHNAEMSQKKDPPMVKDNTEVGPHPIPNDHPLQQEFDFIANKHVALWRCHVFTMDTDATTRVSEAARNVLQNC